MGNDQKFLYQLFPERRFDDRALYCVFHFRADHSEDCAQHRGAYDNEEPIGQVCRHFHHFHRDGRLIYRARDRRRQCARLFYRGHIAAFSAIALAVALALQDSLASLANGIIIIFTKPFKKGDYVEINGKDGLVQDIRLFNTKIVTYNNEEILIPNNQILGSTLINYSTMSLRRVVIEVPIPYSAELSEVKEILLSTLNSHQDVVKTPAPAVVLDGYGDSALKFKARAWTPNEKYWDTRASLFEMIFNNLREKGIEIPFNQLDVHLQRDEEKEANAQ